MAQRSNMKSKIKLVYRVSKRVAKKAGKGQLQYRGKSLGHLTVKATGYAFRFGPKAFLTRIKQEIVSIDRRVGANLYFPNGLVSGVDEGAVLGWYKEKARPVTVV